MFICVAGTPPDLVVLPEDLSVPPYMVEGSTYRIEATVRNVGCEAAQYNFDVRFLQAPPSDPDNWSTIETLSIFELDPGEPAIVGTRFSPDEPGRWHIKVVVDDDEEIAESNEDNNETLSTPLVLSGIEISPAVSYDWHTESLDVYAVVFNNWLGEPATGPPGWVTWKLFDSDGMIVPGYGDHMPLTYDAGDARWEDENHSLSGGNNGRNVYRRGLLGLGARHADRVLQGVGHCPG